MNREHEVLNAYAEALHEAQITGLAFIRVNANGHVQVLPSDRVQLSVIQAVEEQESRARGCGHPRRLIWEMDNQVCEACDICHTVRIRAVK